MGTAHSSIVPYQSFKTKDGYLTLGTGSDVQFVDLCRRLKVEHLAQNPKFKTNKDRVTNRVELLGILEQMLSEDTSRNWMKLFEGASFPVGPVNSIPEVFEDEHIKAIGLVKSLRHPKDGTIKVVGPPVTFSDARNDARTAPPILGQHTDEVLGELLGYGPDELAKLKKDNIIQ